MLSSPVLTSSWDHSSHFSTNARSFSDRWLLVWSSREQASEWSVLTCSVTWRGSVTSTGKEIEELWTRTHLKLVLYWWHYCLEGLCAHLPISSLQCSLNCRSLMFSKYEAMISLLLEGLLWFWAACATIRGLRWWKSAEVGVVAAGYCICLTFEIVRLIVWRKLVIIY